MSILTSRQKLILGIMAVCCLIALPMAYVRTNEPFPEPTMDLSITVPLPPPTLPSVGPYHGSDTRRS